MTSRLHREALAATLLAQMRAVLAQRLSLVYVELITKPVTEEMKSLLKLIDADRLEREVRKGS